MRKDSARFLKVINELTLLDLPILMPLINELSAIQREEGPLGNPADSLAQHAAAMVDSLAKCHKAGITLFVKGDPGGTYTINVQRVDRRVEPPDEVKAIWRQNFESYIKQTSIAESAHPLLWRYWYTALSYNDPEIYEQIMQEHIAKSGSGRDGA